MKFSSIEWGPFCFPIDHNVLTPARPQVKGEMNQNKDKPTGQDKRRLYLIFFCIAAGVELVRYAWSIGDYRPTMVGLAIMITGGLFYAYSWITDR